VRPGDRLILYGRIPRIAEIDARRKGEGGNRAHREAQRQQSELTSEEKRRADR
jgi:hypothetical protein